MSGDSIKRLVVVSNRLPIAMTKTARGRWTVAAGTGGLVTALSPVLRHRGGVWIGWIGADHELGMDEALRSGSKETGYDLVSVPLTKEDVDGYYVGFSNEILWPLFHDLPSMCNYDPSYWPVYERVNRRFAEVIASSTADDSYIWVQDYHLMLAARELKNLGAARRLGFFLHIPFPPDIFIKLPWRRTILEALLDYDLLGFQTLRDRRNFIQCVRLLLPWSARTKGTRSLGTLAIPERDTDVRVGSFAISIDSNDFERRARAQAVEALVERLRAELPGRQLMLGLDRLDYTKGIPHRLRAFGEVLARYPELHRKISFIQVVVPSRTRVGEYRDLKDEIDRLVGELNGRYSRTGWTPIHYLFRSLTDTELLAYYRACEIALITPLKDGMNLVAKEYCACTLDDNGVLILSEFAGAAPQLQAGALLVNPNDLVGTAEAIYQAFTMPRDKRRTRMRKLRRLVQQNDIYRWVNQFLSVAIAKDLRDFPAAGDDGPRDVP